MALSLHALPVLKDCLPFKTVLSLGYPDVLAPVSVVNQFFGIHMEGTTDHGAWHGVKYPLPETMEFFERLGSKLTCVDIRPSRGVETVVDLNFPVTMGFFDLVIDSGTIEHCFHIGQALLNAAESVKPGGRIFHGTPMSMINHGFYNVCPTLYWDFYTQNGWTVEQFYAIDREGKFYDVPNAKRFQSVPEMVLYCLAKRPEDSPLKPLIIPVQEKYRVNPLLH